MALPIAIETAPTWATKHLVLPALLGETVDYGTEALTGKSWSQRVSEGLQSLGMRKGAADFVGGMTNPGYWFNPAGGKVFKPLLDWSLGGFAKGGLSQAQRQYMMNQAL